MSEGKVCPTCGSEYPMSERFCPRDGSALKTLNPQADLVGTMIAQNYHVIKKLGEGGMGAVYLAEHVKMGRKSAIKVMNPGMAQDADAIARFNREASNASRLNHPSICGIYDFGETTEGLIYLAMEYIEGQSLTSLIEKNGSLPPARAASILLQTAEGLQVAHDYGIVHRDLKPDNIMIAKGRDGSDVVKVVDFGIAKAHSSDSQKVTKTGLVVGTPEYMSPEQLSGDKLDGRSDIYSLALVGFNMLTGALPFPSTSAQESMIMRLTDKPKSLGEMKPNIGWSPELQRVMDRALARDVNERYQKAADFGREFSMAVEAMPATSLTEGATQLIGAAAAAQTAAIPKTRLAADQGDLARKSVKEGAAPTPAPVPAKKSAGMMVAAAVIVVALGGGGYWMLNKPGTGTAQTPSTQAPPNPSSGTDTGTKANTQTATSPSTPGRGDGTKLLNSPVSGGDRGAPSGGAANSTSNTNTSNPGSSNPAAATSAATTVLASYTDVMNRILSDKLTDADAEAGLRRLEDVFGDATPAERTRIYVLRALFNYKLDKDDASCRAANNALAGVGLSKQDATDMQTVKSQLPKCT